MSGLASHLKSRRNDMLNKDASMNSFQNIYFSGTTYSLWKTARDITSKYSTGIVLDAGSGRGGWRDIILENAEKREALDWQALEGEELDWVADLTNMPHVPTERFDTVVCHQVLEHISDPAKAMSEIGRVLKKNGHLVLSVPHLSRLHELPHDYFRYTPNGIAIMAEQNGFEIEKITTSGGLFTFLHHQFSTIFIGFATVTTITYKIATYINAPISMFTTLLDSVFDKRALLPNCVVAILKKGE